MQFEVRLFPDTGHHYYFVPLAVDAEEGEFKETYKVLLPQLTGGADEQVKHEAGQKPGWQAAIGPELSWLRYNLGTRRFPKKGRFLANQDEGAFADVHGLWLAIETNTGGAERGTVKEIIDNPSQSDAGYLQFRAAPNDRKPTPYIKERPEYLWSHRSINDPPGQPMTVDLKAACGLDGIVAEEEFALAIVWLEKLGEPIPVDLIIDFGNARTTALGFQRAGRLAQLDLLSTVCRPILFGSHADEPFDAKLTDYGNLDAAELAAASGIALRQPAFQQQENLASDILLDTYEEEERKWVDEKKSWRGTIRTPMRQLRLARIVRRRPQMFVELSPTLMGESATAMLAKTPIQNLASFLSSPKRYAWDSDPVGGIPGQVATIGGVYWLMQRYLQPAATAPVKLSGPLCLFLPMNPANRFYGDPRQAPPPLEWEKSVEQPMEKPLEPSFPTADSLVWTALTILEQAYRQINSEAWREADVVPLRRALGDVVVTYPPGWTKEERDAYFNAWKYARNIFYWSRYPYMQPTKPNPPVISMQVDEAVAAQLPILFADIRHLGNRGSTWVDLFGRERLVKGAKAKTVRVLSIDIGGGTTDTAIVEYANESSSDRGSVHLVSSNLLTDSSTVAGDKLVQLIIERVLLPQVGLAFRDASGAREGWKENFLDILNGDGTYGIRLRRRILARTVFVPMVLRWLEDINKGRKGKWSPSDCARGGEGEILHLIRTFNAEFGPDALLPSDQPFVVDYEKVKSIVQEWALGLVDIHARYTAAFDCDLVLVTGKPSELRDLHTVFRRHLPIERHRLVFAHGYHAGKWFPLHKGGIIEDAKMVTVTGAALHQAMQVNLIEGWSIKSAHHDRRPPVRNYWGVNSRAQDGRVQGFVDDGPFLVPGGPEQAEVEIDTNDSIGRARFLRIDPEPVYKFRWKPGRMPPNIGTQTLKAQIRRVTKDAENREAAIEHLQLVGVKGEVVEIDGRRRAVTLDDVELKLHTLAADAHWLDAGQFNVDWDQS